jgi:hypothetical protein
MISKKSECYKVVPIVINMNKDEVNQSRYNLARDLFKPRSFVKIDCITCNIKNIKIDSLNHYGHVITLRYPTSVTPDVVPFHCRYCREPFLALYNKKKHEDICTRNNIK